MKWYYKIGIGLAIGLIAYLVGNWIPISYLRPKIVETDVDSSQYLSIVISSISAIVTFLAVIVALFKEDIRKFWEYSSLNVSIPENNIIEKLNTQSSSAQSSEEIHLEAQFYNSRIVINNSGNISAVGAELYLEKLEFKNEGYTTMQNIETSGSPLNWSGTDKISIIIPPGGKKPVDIVELVAPEKQSLPDGEDITIPSKLIIGNVKNLADFDKGKWTGTFGLYSQNAKPLRFQVVVEWSGRWEKRLTEMKKFLKIEIKDN
jgi:hypothetical protein